MQPRGEPRRAGRPVSLLVVDDSAPYRAALRAAVLGDPRFELVGALSGAAETLDFLAEHEPDALVVDYVLEDGSGLDVLSFARTRRPDVVVVLHSVRPAPPGWRLLATSDSVAWVMKGGDVAALLDHVAATCGARGPADAVED